MDPQNPDPFHKRRAIAKIADHNLIQEFKSTNPTQDCNRHLRPHFPIRLTEDFVDKFDCVIVNNFFYLLTDNWNVLKNRKNVFFRTYYYTSPQQEHQMGLMRQEGLKVIRMFEEELTLKGGCPTDFLIPNHIDPNEYDNWVGNDLSILTFQNDFATRITHRDEYGTQVFKAYAEYINFIKANPDLKYKLHGYNNNVPGFDRGTVSWEEQKELYKDSRIYFSLGSFPAPYTYNFLEAMCVGTPTLNFGPKLGDYDHPWFSNSYRVHKIIENEVDGFYSDDINVLASYARELLNNETLAKQVSVKAREKIIKLFSIDNAVVNWKAFFDSL